MFYKKIKGKVECGLCPHKCLLAEGAIGQCGVRRNAGGQMRLMVFGKVSALHVDPVEKKPLFHFFPGSSVLSVGSYGCNLHCNFCQNWQLSQINPSSTIPATQTTIDDIMAQVASTPGNIGLAYTYNEPTVWFEFMHELAVKIAVANQKNVMISNGYINPEPLNILLDYIDAFNIDLKAFDNSFYHHFAGGTLFPVLESLKQIAKREKHLEITNLVIPSKNTDLDKFTEMVEWIAGELGPDTVLHLSRYYPNYKLVLPPTPASQLNDLYHIARQKLNYVYLGNTPDTNTTHCPKCNTLLIERQGYQTTIAAKLVNGQCQQCGHRVLKPGCF